ncbi:MAG: hypothetical protein JWO30_2293 [Fibrobacteres bacterium]|nr:hypothetical protein [Fibrobacterota bacterium]
MLIVPGNMLVKLQKLPRLAKLAALVSSLSIASWCQGTSVDFQGTVIDAKGAPVAGASVKLLESSLATTTDAQGLFALKGSVSIGVIHRTVLPGNLNLRYRNGMLFLEGAGSGRIRAEWISPDGSVRAVRGSKGKGSSSWQLDLDGLAGRGAGVHWVRIISETGSNTFRFVSAGAGTHGILFGGSVASTADASSRTLSARTLSDRTLAKAAASGFVLEVSATGFLAKRFAQPEPVKAGLSLALLASGAGLKERIQDFIGAGNTFKLAFLKLEAPGSRKYILNYADFQEMAGDTMPQHAFADSRGPANSPYGAFAPSWSPDGRSLAYETGWENLTTPNSRVYIQPLSGSRVDGPGYPATNPRWWTDGKDTSLVWCSSGREDAWADTASATYRQRVVGGSLSGSPEILSKGSYNAGLSPDGRYLATAFRFALMQELDSKTRRFLHVYPGHPPASDGSSTDSLQACNGSVSQDPAHPSRMLFLDFGVPDEPSYPNPVTPKLYAQHRMILIGDFASDAPGRIVDFIDSPAAELAVENTWDDPEWTNAADFAVATTRDPDGDKSIPGDPASTQPDIYLIKLSTKESIKVFSGVNQVLPAAWIGPKP